MFLLLLLYTSILFSQVTGVVVTYDTGSIQAASEIGPMGYGGTMTITASGAWTVNNGTCTSLHVKNRTGTNSASNRFSWDFVGGTSIPSNQPYLDGSCSGTITGLSASSIPFTINRRVFRKNKPLFVTNLFGERAPSGFTDPFSGASLYPYSFTPSSGEGYPPNDGTAFPAIGETWNDSHTGGFLTRVGLTDGADYSVAYSGIRFSKNGTYTFTRNRGIIRATYPYDKIAPGPWEVGITGCDVSGNMFWSYASTTELVAYCFDRADKRRIRKFTITPGSPGSITEVCSGSPCSTNPWYEHTYQIINSSGAEGTGAGSPITGSTDQISVMCAVDNKSCVIDLQNKTSVCISHVSGRDYRVSMMSPHKDYFGNLYMFFGADNPSSTNLAKLDKNGTLTYIGDIPTPNVHNFEDGHVYGLGCDVTEVGCTRTGHMSFFFANGRPGLMGNVFGNRNYYPKNGDYIAWGAMWASSEQFAGQPEEAGGGFTPVYGVPSEYGTCSLGSPICIQSIAAQDTRIRGLSNCNSVSTTITCTVGVGNNADGQAATGSDNIYTNGQRVLLNRMSIAGWNGFQTLTASSGSTISFTSATSGSSGTGFIGVASLLSTNAYNESHVIAIRQDNGHARFLFKPPPFNTNVYYGLPHTFPSYNGGKFLVSSQFGYPGEANTFISDTGFRCPIEVRPHQFCGNGDVTGVSGGLSVRESTGQIQFVVQSPLQNGSCILEYSTQSDYSNSTTVTTTSSPRITTITGLSTGDKRYARVYCDGNDPNGILRSNWHYAINEGISK